MKEYRVREQQMSGPHKGEWVTAWHPNGGKLIHTFKTFEDAQNWIAAQPEWYEKYNKRLPSDLHREVPPYKIEVRDVTPWETLE